MNFVLQPWQLLLIILAGWVNRRQQQINDYLRTENQVLKEKLGRRRLLLNGRSGGGARQRFERLHCADGAIRRGERSRRAAVASCRRLSDRAHTRRTGQKRGCPRPGGVSGWP